MNEVFTDRLLSDRIAQKKLMRLLTKVFQKQTFAEGFAYQSSKVKSPKKFCLFINSTYYE